MSIRIATARFCSSIAGKCSNNGITMRTGAPPSLSYRCKSSVGAPKSSGTSTTIAKDAANVTKEAAPAAVEASSSSSSESVPIGTTLIAMTLAIGTVSAGAALAENATSSMVPTFDPKSQRFDQSTFMGRLSKMLLACDPSLLFCSGDKVQRCKKMVDEYKTHLTNLPEGTTETEMSRKLWEAQRVASAALHPDTGDTIPLPFRMSGFVPFNGPICGKLICCMLYVVS